MESMTIAEVVPVFPANATQFRESCFLEVFLCVVNMISSVLSKLYWALLLFSIAYTKKLRFYYSVIKIFSAFFRSFSVNR